MRKNQISVDICVPDYVTLKLCQDGYQVKVALPVTEEVSQKIRKYIDFSRTEILEPNARFNRKFYCVVLTKFYKYNVSFKDSCFIQANIDHKKLMRWARLCKQQILDNEIHSIDYQLSLFD